MTGLQGSEDLEVSHFSHTATPYRETDRATEMLEDFVLGPSFRPYLPHPKSKHLVFLGHPEIVRIKGLELN